MFFAVTEKSDYDLDNVAIDKYSQKVRGLCRSVEHLSDCNFKRNGKSACFLIVISPFGLIDANTQGLGPYKKGMANLHGDVRCRI